MTDVGQSNGVTIGPLTDGVEFPTVIRCTNPSMDIETWASSNRNAIDRLISSSGAILFRGFAINGYKHFSRFVESASTGEWVGYREAATPRTRVGGQVFTSTEYNPELRIYVHNENSHVKTWPLYIFFYCKQPAVNGGATPIADCRAIYRRLPNSLISRFDDVGWMYVRNFHPTSSIPWQKAYGTESREGVERYCKQNHMIPEWAGTNLTVRYRRWAALRHPRTGEMTWFNHGTFFNPYTLEPRVKELALAIGLESLPYSTCYGDGTSIDEETLRTLDDAYKSETITFPWNANDILMLDNMRMAHGREPFHGRREVLVAMKQRVRCEDLAEARHYSTVAAAK